MGGLQNCLEWGWEEGKQRIEGYDLDPKKKTTSFDTDVVWKLVGHWKPVLRYQCRQGDGLVKDKTNDTLEFKEYGCAVV